MIRVNIEFDNELAVIDSMPLSGKVYISTNNIDGGFRFIEILNRRQLKTVLKERPSYTVSSMMIYEVLKTKFNLVRLAEDSSITGRFDRFNPDALINIKDHFVSNYSQFFIKNAILYFSRYLILPGFIYDTFTNRTVAATIVFSENKSLVVSRSFLSVIANSRFLSTIVNNREFNRVTVCNHIEDILNQFCITGSHFKLTAQQHLERQVTSFTADDVLITERQEEIRTYGV